MPAPYIVGPLAFAVLGLAVIWAFCRIAAWADRDDTEAPYEEQPCRVCGLPTAFTLHGVPLHPSCRDLGGED